MNGYQNILVLILIHFIYALTFQVTKEQLYYARLEPGDDGVWELFAEDGEMRLFKREEEVDGKVMDPLKAYHQVEGQPRKNQSLKGHI